MKTKLGPRVLTAILLIALAGLFGSAANAATPVVDQSQPVIDANVVTGIGALSTSHRCRASPRG